MSKDAVSIAHAQSLNMDELTHRVAHFAGWTQIISKAGRFWGFDRNFPKDTGRPILIPDYSISLSQIHNLYLQLPKEDQLKMLGKLASIAAKTHEVTYEISLLKARDWCCAYVALVSEKK